MQTWQKGRLLNEGTVGEKLRGPMSKNCKNKIIVRDKLVEKAFYMQTAFYRFMLVEEIFPINQFAKEDDFVGKRNLI